MISQFEEQIGTRQVEYHPVETTAGGLTRMTWVFRVSDDPRDEGYGEYANLAKARNRAREILFDREVEEVVKEQANWRGWPLATFLWCLAVLIYFYLMS